MSTHRGHFERRHHFLKKEFELLEQREKVLEEKLQSKPKVSRKRLQDMKKFEILQNEYKSLIERIEIMTSDLKEKFGDLETFIEKFYINY